MRGRLVNSAVLGILLIYQISACLATEAPNPNECSKYLDAVREFADNVLKCSRDTYSPKHTPLMALHDCSNGGAIVGDHTRNVILT